MMQWSAKRRIDTTQWSSKARPAAPALILPSSPPDVAAAITLAPTKFADPGQPPTL